MAASLNKVIIAGNVTQDVEARTVGQGSVVANLSVALTEGWKDKTSGQWKEFTTYVDVKVWGQQAENAAKYVKKGHKVLVEGKLKMEAWKDKTTGDNRSKMVVQADNVIYLTQKTTEDQPLDSDGFRY